jgi:molecular chaperone DnaK
MLLGQFRLEGIPPAPRGVPQIEVTFDIDANGILNVSARDKSTGKEQRVTITASTNLSKQEVDRLVAEAERHAADDRRRRELAEARNQADTVIYQAEKVMREAGYRLLPDDKSRLQTQINDLRQAMSGDDLARIRQLSQALEQVVASLSQQPGPGEVGQPGEAYAGQAGQSGPPPYDNTVEGEFREV